MACVLDERFNQILTVDNVFYLLKMLVRDENKTQTIFERKRNTP